MRTLRLFLYFTALAGLLLGVGQCVGLALGGTSRDLLLGQGFVLLALGFGARYQGAGHVPLRASFALLGLAGALPLLAGFAPLGAAFAAFLFLPLRATGARLSAAVAVVPAGTSLLALATFLAWFLTSAWAPGLPGFLLLWLISGILQRWVLPAAQETASPAPDPGAVLQGLLASAGLVLFFLFFSPYLQALDAGALPHDLRRGLALGCVFFSCWFTLGSGFAESRLRPIMAAGSAAAIAFLIPSFTGWVRHVTTPKGYATWLKNPEWGWFETIEGPIVPEEHALYIPFVTLVAFAIPCALGSLMLRNLMRQDGPGPGPQGLAPVLGGAGVAFCATALWSSGALLDHLGTLASLFLFAAALLAVWGLNVHPPLRWAGVGLALVLAGLFLRPTERPVLEYPLVDNIQWGPTLAREGQAWAPGTAIQEEDLFALPRLLHRRAATLGGARRNDLLFDGRNNLAASDRVTTLRRREALFAETLAGNPEKVCWVGVPELGMVETLLEDPERQFTFACDPPSLARLALVDHPGRSFDLRRGLAASDGPYDLILLHSAAMWEPRHSLLRVELLRQAALRLEADGVCLFFAGPEDFVPGLLPQWIEEFDRVFEQTTVFVIPDGLRQARLVLAGRRLPEQGPAWPLPTGSRLDVLASLGLPLLDADDLASLEVRLEDPLSAGRYWTFRGPFRPADAALAGTVFLPRSGVQVPHRAAAVCAELQAFERSGHASLLGFYAAQFQAQEYSTHDDYLDGNPFAIETSAQALDMLLRTTVEFPDSAPLHRTWAEVGVGLVEAREVEWIDTYFTRLVEDLGWQDPEVHLALAHAAIEMLDFEKAMAHLDLILSRHPDFLPAQELRALAERGEQVPRDTHAGHNH